MNVWLEWGTPIIVWLQRMGGWLTAPMQAVTFLGTEEFFMLLMPAILWCADVALGFRMGMILIGSASLNSMLKLAFGWPRPYWVSTQVRALSAETSFGLPSGHAQTAAALWGRLAAGVRRMWVTLACLILIFLISISRLYLGVHFPSDMLAGWLAGGLLLWLFLRYEGMVGRWMAARDVGQQLAVVLAASLLILALGLGVHAATAGYPVPTAWAEAAALATPDADPIEPRSIEGVVSNAGLILGIGAGGVLLFAWGKYSAAGPGWKRVLRYLLGMLGVVAFWMGLRLVFPGGETALALILRYLRYAITGVWAVYLAPRAFVALRLA